MSVHNRLQMRPSSGTVAEGLRSYAVYISRRSRGSFSVLLKLKAVFLFVCLIYTTVLRKREDGGVCTIEHWGGHHVTMCGRKADECHLFPRIFFYPPSLYLHSTTAASNPVRCRLSGLFERDIIRRFLRSSRRAPESTRKHGQRTASVDKKTQ